MSSFESRSSIFLCSSSSYGLPFVFVVASCCNLRWERRACRTCRAIANEAQSSATKASIEMQKRTRIGHSKDNKAGGVERTPHPRISIQAPPVDDSGSFYCFLIHFRP